MHPDPSAEQAVEGLLSLLRDAEAAFDHPESFEGALVRVSSAAAQMELFELRFGCRRDRVRGWPAVREAAARLLERADRARGQGPYFNRDSIEVARGGLLALAGRYEEALALFEGVRPGGGCGNWHATVMLSVHQRRSAILEMAGRWKEALDEQRKALGAAHLSLYDEDADVRNLRLAHLLEKAGNEAGARDAYQRVVDLYPRTVAGGLGRRALERKGALVEPTAARIVSLYAGRVDHVGEREAGMAALAAHRFAESYDLLVGWFIAPQPDREMQFVPEAPRSPHELWEYDRARLIDALGVLGDRRAIPHLREYAARSGGLRRRQVEQAIAAIESSGAEPS